EGARSALAAPAVRVLVQRVKHAQVSVGAEVVGSIRGGLLLLVGVCATDTDVELLWMAKKCSQLRIFADPEGKMNRSLIDVRGEALIISQFPLYGDARKGTRPSFIEAARPEVAAPLIDRFAELLSAELSRPVATGRFGADMQVELLNDGPVTI